MNHGNAGEGGCWNCGDIIDELRHELVVAKHDLQLANIARIEAQTALREWQMGKGDTALEAECERLKAESDALHDVASELYGEAEWEPTELHGRVVELLDERDALKAERDNARTELSAVMSVVVHGQPYETFDPVQLPEIVAGIIQERDRLTAENAQLRADLKASEAKWERLKAFVVDAAAFYRKDPHAFSMRPEELERVADKMRSLDAERGETKT